MFRTLGLVLAFLFLLGCVSTPPVSPSIPSDGAPRACWGAETCVGLEVVSSPADRARGLMFRETLSERAGMLFVFEDSSIHPFWMKNTLIPLDMIWLDAQGTVVDIQTAIPCEADPCPLYTPAGHSSFVLEIPAGVATKTMLEKGARVRLENIPVSS